MLKAGRFTVMCALIAICYSPCGVAGESLAQEDSGSHAVVLESIRDHVTKTSNSETSYSALSSSQDTNSKPAIHADGTQLMKRKDKLAYCLRSIYGPTTTVFSIIGAGMSQAIDSVPEWGQGMEGYGKRLGSRYAHKATRYSIEGLMEIILGEDPRYFSSPRQGIWRRTWHATREIFLTAKDSGGRGPAYSKMIAIGSALYISRQWHPESEREISSYISSVALCLGVEAAKNIFAEFWPDVRRNLRR